jgi:hypothetical protein
MSADSSKPALLVEMRILYIVAILAGAVLGWAASSAMGQPLQSVVFTALGSLLAFVLMYIVLSESTKTLICLKLPNAHFVDAWDTAGIEVDLVRQLVFAGRPDTGAILRFDQISRIDVEGDALVFTTTDPNAPRVQVTVSKGNARPICSSLHAELEDYWTEKNAAEAASDFASAEKLSPADRDPYAILGVRAGVSNEELRAAYVRRLHEFRESLSHHVYPNHAHLIAIEEAYKTLNSPLNSLEHHSAGLPKNEWMPSVAAALLSYPWFALAVGASISYYALATVDFNRSITFFLYSGFVFVISCLTIQAAVDKFYGAEFVKRWSVNPGRLRRMYRAPDESLFYPTMLSNISAARKRAGYMYAFTTTVAFMSMGAILSFTGAYMIFQRSPVPPFWTRLTTSGVPLTAWAAGISILVLAILAGRVTSNRQIEVPTSLIAARVRPREDASSEDDRPGLPRPWLDQPVSIVIALIGLGGLLWSGTTLVETMIARSWPTATGKIVSSGVDVTGFQGRRTFPTYTAYVAYSYEVDGEKLFGDRICFCIQSGFQSDAEGTPQAYEAGKAVLIHYRPGHPKDSVLDTDIRPFSVSVPALFGLLFLTLGWRMQRSS